MIVYFEHVQYWLVTCPILIPWMLVIVVQWLESTAGTTGVISLLFCQKLCNHWGSKVAKGLHFIQIILIEGQQNGLIIGVLFQIFLDSALFLQVQTLQGI